MMDWSYELLNARERTLFRRLSAFAGGFTLEAAEIVCADAEIQPTEVLDLLTHLVGKSLVVFEERDEEARYRFLETVRQYARDKLLETGEAAHVRERHRDCNFSQKRPKRRRRCGPRLCMGRVCWRVRKTIMPKQLRS